jgi:hypothetical protein
MALGDDVITLPVPEGVRATYLVPAAATPPDLADRVASTALARWDGVLGFLLADLIGGPGVPVDVRSADDLPPLPVELLAVMGADDEQLDRITAAREFVILSVQSRPGWPPAHEWVTRAIAIVAAQLVNGDVIDIANHQVLDPDAAASTLPDHEGHTRLADWVWVNYSADSAGYWCTTTGLVRFGLPELQTLTAPPNVVEAWGRAMTGLARRLVAIWSETLDAHQDAAFVQLPSTVELGPEDVSGAYGRHWPERPTTAAKVRLTLDPSSDPTADSFLTIHPPLEWSGSAGEHISAVCRALFGSPTVQIRHAEPSPAMDQAIATARAGLTDIRGRFESGALDLREKLLVKYALPTDRGTEYLWAYVTSWRDPYRILATSAADAVYQPKVRAGRPVVVDTAAVVDWAVEHDERGVVEGAWTQAALDQD